MLTSEPVSVEFSNIVKSYVDTYMSDHMAILKKISFKISKKTNQNNYGRI